jgi:hypothetical protein
VNALKYLPWRSLTLAALLSVIVVKATDLWIGQLLGQLGSTSLLLMKFLLTPTGSTLLFFCGGLAIGSLGVVCLEKFEARRAINSSSLWALVLCILISLWIVVQVNVKGLSLGEVNYTHTMGIVVGVFWKGRYYRY